MKIVATLLVRELTLAEAQLAQLSGPLARHAQQLVHEALRDVQTIERLQDRRHVLGSKS